MKSTTACHARRTVIVADDNAGMRAFIRMLVTPLADVRECADGAEAVTAYAALQPDCVLMDIRMLPMDGIEATLRIRAGDPDALVIIVTDVRDASVLDAAQAAGAQAVVSKEDLLDVPLLLNELLTSTSTSGDET